MVWWRSNLLFIILLLRKVALLAATSLVPLSAQPAAGAVERWGIFEAAFHGPDSSNPFLEVHFQAQFRFQDRVVDADEFYDGAGVYRVRFMPDATGDWTYLTWSNRRELDGKTGRFICVPPSPGNHGPV